MNAAIMTQTKQILDKIIAASVSCSSVATMLVTTCVSIGDILRWQIFFSNKFVADFQIYSDYKRAGYTFMS